MTPLSAKQKAVLSQLCRKAFLHLAGQALAAGQPFDDSAEALNQFRHREVLVACGRHGLRAAENKHYSAIAGRFEELAGNSGRAFNHEMRSQSEGERTARVVLERTLVAANLPPEYAASISLDRWNCLPEDLSESQTWQLIYTLKARMRSKRKQTAEVAA